jgi:hypothetical protein
MEAEVVYFAKSTQELAIEANPAQEPKTKTNFT